MIIKLITPLIIFTMLRLMMRYLKNYSIKNSENKFTYMIECDNCGTFVEESIIVQKFHKKFCSYKCSNL